MGDQLDITSGQLDITFTEPFYEDDRWRGQVMAGLYARGISARRAAEIVDGMVRRYRDEAARDAAYDSREGWGE
jgi:hypothetical protein